MSQHDYDIANATFPNVRTDLNNVLGAIKTTNSGSTAPSSVGTGQIWLDTSTTPWVLKMYDGTDHITLLNIDATSNLMTLPGISGNPVGTTDTQALTNKTINASVIGGVTPAAGSFTALTATGAFTSLGIDDNATTPIITLASSSAYFRNNGSATASVAIHLAGSSASTGASFEWSNPDGYLWNYNAGQLIFGTNNVERLRLGGSGAVYINDNSNANMTIGLTINQGAADDELIAGKSSDIAHGMTGIAETDTWLAIKKFDGNAGGAEIAGFSESTLGLMLRGYYTTDDTTHTAAGRAAVEVRALLKSGATTTNPGANANMFAVATAGGSTKFIVDSEGDLFADGSDVTVYDDEDDEALVEVVDYHRSGGNTIDDDYRDWALNQIGLSRLVELNLRGEGPDGLWNITKLQRLHNGTLRRQTRRINALTAELAIIREQFKQIEVR